MNAGSTFEKRPGVALNPCLPEYEYVPDGEPHVFGDRIYIYGSHDLFGGKIFCMGDYVSYSASVKDLTKWRFEGVIYRKTQDPRMLNGDKYLWAPDVVQGKDGRYYLYYCPDDTVPSAIGVAVCDTPAGQYQFYGIVHDQDGNWLGQRPGDTIAFDPGVYMDDDGSIYLYSGNGPRTEKAIGKEPKASVVAQLCDDMLTLKTEPVKLLPALGESAGTGFEGHEFFEASSIRKINGLYYLVYSSVKLHQLCYAVSSRPDGGYRYGGVLISNAEYFEQTDPVLHNCWGNNHGSIELIDGQYYIFYHCPTNRSMYSRQGRAEKLTILPDGSIPQVHMTSQGLNQGPLPASGTWPASCVCILQGQKPQAIAHPLAMGRRHPYITQDGPDFPVESAPENAEAPRQYITNGKNGMTACFRYFDVQQPAGLTVTLKGSMKGSLEVRTGRDGPVCGSIPLSPSDSWKVFGGDVQIPAGRQELYLHFKGRGKLHMLEFTFV